MQQRTITPPHYIPLSLSTGISSATQRKEAVSHFPRSLKHADNKEETKRKRAENVESTPQPQPTQLKSSFSSGIIIIISKNKTYN